ncbi:MAG: hypothetical protein GAK35_01068 [Herbaspirillum frisingense]|uniref:Uncharacterized protein n=1 Tax=Herbaspirillum frisingense TaxID=92645 RepID=A0A7V8FYS0_9BURK|nr:MAG: hypothetical protein GAK35_01068 [Herbaspirillum frisingense]
MKKKLTHVMADGRITTRETARTYSHVVEVRLERHHPNNKSWFSADDRSLLPVDAEGFCGPFVWKWCGRADLAAKEAASYNKCPGLKASAVAIQPA